MILESMEQRVANTPAVLLCDDCLKKDCCKWIDEMKTVVVTTDKNCYGRPFKPEAWTCQLYLEEKHRDLAEAIAEKYKDPTSLIKKEMDAARAALKEMYPDDKKHSLPYEDTPEAYAEARRLGYDTLTNY